VTSRIKLSDLPIGHREQAIKQINAQGNKSSSLSSERGAKNQEKDPQFVLTRSIKSRWSEVEVEYSPGIKGRKFRIDLAFPGQKLAIEVDGWQHHGKFKKSFQKDREKQNLLVVNGWRVLRFFYKEIMADESRHLIIEMIDSALNNTSK